MKVNLLLQKHVLLSSIYEKEKKEKKIVSGYEKT